MFPNNTLQPINKSLSLFSGSFGCYYKLSKVKMPKDEKHFVGLSYNSVALSA